MIDRTGAFSFAWREWAWFAALFLSSTIQTVLVFFAYKNIRRRFIFNLNRINFVDDGVQNEMRVIKDIVEDMQAEQRKNRSWLRK